MLDIEILCSSIKDKIISQCTWSLVIVFEKDGKVYIAKVETGEAIIDGLNA